MSNSVIPWNVACQSPLSMGILQARILEWLTMPSHQGIFPTQWSNPGLPHCRQTLPSEPPGKPKNTGVGSLSLLQGIFLTQEWNPGLLHCRRILTSWATREAHNDWLLVHKRGWLSRGPAHYSNSISDSNKLYTPLSFSLMSGNSFTASAQTMAGSRDDLRFYA